MLLRIQRVCNGLEAVCHRAQVRGPRMQEPTQHEGTMAQKKSQWCAVTGTWGHHWLEITHPRTVHLGMGCKACQAHRRQAFLAGLFSSLLAGAGPIYSLWRCRARGSFSRVDGDGADQEKNPQGLRFAGFEDSGGRGGT